MHPLFQRLLKQSEPKYLSLSERHPDIYNEIAALHERGTSLSASSSLSDLSLLVSDTTRACRHVRRILHHKNIRREPVAEQDILWYGHNRLVKAENVLKRLKQTAEDMSKDSPLRYPERTFELCGYEHGPAIRAFQWLVNETLEAFVLFKPWPSTPED